MPRLHPARLALGLCSITLSAACVVPADDNPEQVAYSQAGLTSVSIFGSNPGALKMYVYSPADVPANAPLVVAMHGCTQTAQDYVNAGWNQLADQWKFHVVYPEQQNTNNSNRCFNWFLTSDSTRDAGEALSIRQMVDYMKSHSSVDPARVFVTGLSAGGAMTAAMLAVYPDVFAGGAIMAGIPYRCATSTFGAFSCMSPGVDKTPAAWGDLVRAAFLGYAGPRPRVSVWQGTSDTTVVPKNMVELVDQWTNVHGIDATADATSTVSGATRSEYRNAAGQTLVESYSIPSMGHGTAIDPGYAPAGGCGTAASYILDVNLCSTYQVGVFFGLDAGGAGAGG
jgi:poly(hydroxyalkanoate) depolymerase family esterase